MSIDTPKVRQYLKTFDFKSLFREELGWDRFDASHRVQIDGADYSVRGVAEKHGVQIFECPSPAGRSLPPYNLRQKIERHVTKLAFEHLIIYTDAERSTQIWQWVAREPGRPKAFREHHYYPRHQDGDSLIQKLCTIVFPLTEEEGLTITGVTEKLKDAFDRDRVTRRFYDRFKAEHDGFGRFLNGIPDGDMAAWYVSVMLNRLMFIYFLQKKGFLDQDADYLKNKLMTSKQAAKDRFYWDLLRPLFFEGFAKKPADRPAKARQLLGDVPYLNGGIFMPHPIEQQYGKDINIPDKAFEELFRFFDDYNWTLDDRPLQNDREINPDVLGYIFEKYINQKQMGAYYTKEDITGYISKSTVIPFLFDRARENCKVAFDGGQSVWRLLQTDPDRYIYDAVKRGVVDGDGNDIPETSLPGFVQKGMRDAKARMFDKRYNLGAADIPGPNGQNLALPTETWREYVARRERCLDLRRKLAAGDVRSVNDLITYNLDIRQFAQDVIEQAEGPELVRAFWKAIQSVTVLDPACGSGAFLFAALNILEPLYDACLQRMRRFVVELENAGTKAHPKKYTDFKEILDRIEEHPNEPYFVFKSIIVNNLYGLDIMEEAVEICKLRLFLKLVAQIEDVARIEPLPDIDFNIRAGNSLVGYTTYDDVKRAVESKLDFDKTMAKIEDKAGDIDRLFQLFREQQTALGGEVTAGDKDELRKRLSILEGELNVYLAGEYGVDADKAKTYEKWLKTHKPFHWFVDFYGIMKRGGFDVVIGNPPYVKSAQVRETYDVVQLTTSTCPDVYAWFLERNQLLLGTYGRTGMILPLSLGFSSDFGVCRGLLFSNYRENWFSSFGRIPSALFNYDVRVRNTIHIGSKAAGIPNNHTTRLHRWFEVNRPYLFQSLQYAVFHPDLWKKRVPKINTQRLAEAFESAIALRAITLDGVFVSRKTKYVLHFKKTAYNWLDFCRKMPPCFDTDGRRVAHTKFGDIYFSDNDTLLLTMLLANGKLMLIYWFMIADDFDVTKWNFAEFPIVFSGLDKGNLKRLEGLFDKLEVAMGNALQFKLNARRKVGNYNLAKCRDVTDESDLIFARYLGLDNAWDDIQLYYSQVVKTDFEGTRTVIEDEGEE